MTTATSQRKSPTNPHQLVSLWGIMKQFHLEQLLPLTGVASGLASYAYDQIGNSMVPPEVNRKFEVNMAILASECSVSGLKATARACETFLRMIQAGLTFESFGRGISEILKFAEHEMSSRLFFSVDASKEDYCQGPHLFGAEVAEKFPSAIYDIEEAGKCLAFDRGTACVFHCVRIMEIGLKSLSQALRIPYAPSWESHLRQINDKVSAKYKTKGISWRRDEPLFKELAGDLMSIKIAWRNPTMHIVRNYLTDEAEQILQAVRTFMQSLATRFQEVK
jgi:hypothetical protein